MAYHYIMIKDGNAITTNLVGTVPTEDKNGVEVTIRNIKSFHFYEKALKYITFFPNVYLNTIGTCSYIVTTFNDITIKKYNYFAVASKDIENKILLGNVLYPCDSKILTFENQRFYNNLHYNGIVIRFNIGELEVTPNRENIIYNTESIKTINARFNEARNEIIANIELIFPKDYSDLFEYLKAKVQAWTYDPLSNEINLSYWGGFKFSCKDLNLNIKYKGKDLKEYDLLKCCEYVMLPNFRGSIEGDKIYQQVKNTNSRKHVSFTSDRLIILKNTSRITFDIRNYLIDNYEKYAIVGEFSLEDIIIRFISAKRFSREEYNNSTDIQYVVKEIYDRLINNAIIFDPKIDADFLQYKKELGDSKKTQIIKNVCLHITNYEVYGDFEYSKTFSTLDEAITHIKNIKHGVYICPYSENYSGIHQICTRIKGIVLIRVATNIFNKLIGVNFTNRINIHDVVYNDSTIRILFTINKYKPCFADDMLKTIPEPLYSEIVAFKRRYIELYSKHEYIIKAHLSSLAISEEPYTAYLCNRINTYHSIYTDIMTEYDTLNPVFIAAIIRKLKKYRMPLCTYESLNSNKLIQVLCKN